MSTPTSKQEAAQAYWKDNLRLMLVLLVIWFAVSFGAGILFVEQLNHFQFFGFPLGFWFAQQGSIFIFVLMIFFYIWKMNQYDRKHNVHEE